MDRTYHAWQTLRELEPTPRAKRAKRRGFAFALLSAATLGYLLGRWPVLAFLFLAGVGVWAKFAK